MLVKSAVLLKNIIYTGSCCGEILYHLNKLNVDLNDRIEGFIDDKGKFYNREEALDYALKCGQIAKSALPMILLSTDLWPNNINTWNP